MSNAALRLVILLMAGLLSGCTDAKAVNAAFSQTRVSWFLFDPQQAEGLSPFAGFEQGLRVEWRPRPQALFPTDLLPLADQRAALAVSGLGLLVLDDSSGLLTATRPGSALRLTAYRTGRLFVWEDRVFLTLAQEPPAAYQPGTLAWWRPGQGRLALYPIPSQVAAPGRQAIGVTGPTDNSLIGIRWRVPSPSGWRFEDTSFDLASGTERTLVPIASEPKAPGAEFAAVRARLAERLGADVPSKSLTGPGTVLQYTDGGWVAVARVGEGQARLYRLPDLGLAGRYTVGVALQRGYAFCWETLYRGYGGASGVVHVPFGVLAP